MTNSNEQGPPLTPGDIERLAHMAIGDVAALKELDAQDDRLNRAHSRTVDTMEAFQAFPQHQPHLLKGREGEKSYRKP